MHGRRAWSAQTKPHWSRLQERAVGTADNNRDKTDNDRIYRVAITGIAWKMTGVRWAITGIGWTMTGIYIGRTHNHRDI